MGEAVEDDKLKQVSLKFLHLVLWIRIRIGLVGWLRIRSQVGKEKHTHKKKKKKAKKFIDLMGWTWMFSFEADFSYIQ